MIHVYLKTLSAKRICLAQLVDFLKLDPLLLGPHMQTIKVAPIKPSISTDLLDQVDIRVGTINLIEDVKGSEKLVKMTVDFGDYKRTILVGMKQEREDPKQIEGKQALFVINLEPKKIMGEVSEGMLLDIGYADGLKPVLALPEEEVPNGARAG